MRDEAYYLRSGVSLSIWPGMVLFTRSAALPAGLISMAKVPYGIRPERIYGEIFRT